MKRAWSVFGTGIRPYVDLGSALGGMNRIGEYISYQMSYTCPLCGEEQTNYGPSLWRDYLSILYVPLFPLGLCNVTNCYNKATNPYVRLPRSTPLDWMKNYSKYRTWWLAVLYSFVGAGLGWLLAALFPFYVLVIVVLILSYPFLVESLFVNSQSADIPPSLKDVGFLTWTMWWLTSEILPLAGRSFMFLFSVGIGVQYPGFFGILSGIVILNSIFKQRAETHCFFNS